MIKLEHIKKSFDKKIIYKDYSYEYLDNKIYCLVGNSGCGKTTLLRMISGLEKVDSGKIYLDEQVISKPTKEILMMHQHYTNFLWKTCLKNVLFPIEINRKSTVEEKDYALRLLDLVGLKEYKDNFPSELSGGMNQRLAFARSLIKPSKVLLMDEPFSALDTSNKIKMERLLQQVQNITKNTVIMVTHDDAEAKRVANVIVNF